MITRQYFRFKKYDSYKGIFEEAGYLLMPNEVEEFKNLVNTLGFSYSDAFARLTGKDMSEVKDVVLVQECLPIN